MWHIYTYNWYNMPLEAPKTLTVPKKKTKPKKTKPAGFSNRPFGLSFNFWWDWDHGNLRGPFPPMPGKALRKSGLNKALVGMMVVNNPPELAAIFLSGILGGPGP